MRPYHLPSRLHHRDLAVEPRDAIMKASLHGHFDDERVNKLAIDNSAERTGEKKQYPPLSSPVARTASSREFVPSSLNRGAPVFARELCVARNSFSVLQLARRRIGPLPLLFASLPSRGGPTWLCSISMCIHTLCVHPWLCVPSVGHYREREKLFTCMLR